MLKSNTIHMDLILCALLLQALSSSIKGQLPAKETNADSLSRSECSQNLTEVVLEVCIGKCIVNFHNVEYVDTRPPCVCQSRMPGVVVEWLDEGTGESLASGENSVTLELSSKHIDSKIVCRGKQGNMHGQKIWLPPIIYGPHKAEIIIKEPNIPKLYITDKCPASIYFSCHVNRKEVFPSVIIKSSVSITSINEDWRMETQAEMTGNVESEDAYESFFKADVSMTGRVVIQCVAINSVIPEYHFVKKTTFMAEGESSSDGRSRRSSRKQRRHKSRRTIKYKTDENDDAPRTSISGCIVIQDNVRFVDESRICKCQPIIHPSLGDEPVVTEWIDGSEDRVLVYGNRVALLQIKPLIIDKQKDIFCRARLGNTVGPSTRLPEIIYGPKEVKLDLGISNGQLYTSKSCPQRLHYTCRVPMTKIYPKAHITSKTALSYKKKTISALGLPETTYLIAEKSTSQISRTSDAGFDSFVFETTITSPGTLTVFCDAKNTMLDHLHASIKQSIEVKESTMKPTISTRPQGVITEDHIILPKRDNLVITCKAPWGNDPMMALFLKCDEDHQEKAGTNEVTIFIEKSRIKNGTVCECLMRFELCRESGNSGDVTIIFAEQKVEEEEKETSTVVYPIPSVEGSTSEGHIDDHTSINDGVFIGIGVGVTLGIVFVAILFFIIGFKVGIRRTEKNMQKKVDVGKVSFTPNSAVILQPSLPYEFLPEREPLQEAYTDNVNARTMADYSYSHIDYLYQGNDEGPPFGKTSQNDTTKKKETLLSHGNKEKKLSSRKGQGEHFYDQAAVYDRPSDQAIDEDYEGYSRPGA